MGIAQVIDPELAQPRSIASCIPCLVQRGRLVRGDPRHLGAIIPPVLRGEAGASQIARGPTLKSGRHRAVAVNLLPPQVQRIGLAGARVEQEA